MSYNSRCNKKIMYLMEKTRKRNYNIFVLYGKDPEKDGEYIQKKILYRLTFPPRGDLGIELATVFTKIINGEIPCYKILEDENYLAFLDLRPINPGHTLVIPKQEIDYIFDVEDDLLGGLMIFAKKVSCMIKKSVSCKKIG